MEDAFLPFKNGTYQTPPNQRTSLAAVLPSMAFYLGIIKVVYDSWRGAKTGNFSHHDYCHESLEVVRAIEKAGGTVTVTGQQHLAAVDRPFVLVGNHMGHLETMILGTMVGERGHFTYVVKESLLRYPFFGPVLKTQSPISVARENPREDLTIILREGAEQLAEGTPVAVFPQSTRSLVFDPKLFNSVGVKLAKRANVPVLPVAVKTDFWGMGKIWKEVGRIDPSKPVRVAFGEPITVTGNGREAHQACIDFIKSKLDGWVEKDGSAAKALA